MKILGIDSSASSAAVGITQEGKTKASKTCRAGVTHSQILLPLILEQLREVSLSPQDPDIFACTVGPGSFTGLRIAVSLIKGLAFGSGRPCVGVSTLEALAEGIGEDGLLCPVIDARRGEGYCALFSRKDGVFTRLTEDRALPLEELARELSERYPQERILLAGDGAPALAALLPRGELLREEHLFVQGDAVCRCAHRAYLRGEAVEEAALAPVYLRLPQAERERRERLAAEQLSPLS